MRFQAKFLQPPSTTSEPEASLMSIPDVFRTPDGRVEGEDEDLTAALEHKDAVTGRAPVDGNLP